MVRGRPGGAASPPSRAAAAAPSPSPRPLLRADLSGSASRLPQPGESPQREKKKGGKNRKKEKKRKKEKAESRQKKKKNNQKNKTKTTEAAGGGALPGAERGTGGRSPVRCVLSLRAARTRPAGGAAPALGLRAERLPPPNAPR